MLRAELYRALLLRDGETLARWTGFVPVYPLIVREADETGGDVEAVAGDAGLIESGLSQEPILVQHAMDVDPFDRMAALWTLGRCAWEDATRWLLEFPALVIGPDLWLAVGLDYSLGTGATRRLLRYAQTAGGGGGSLAEWVRDFAPDATKPPFSRWWGRAKPTKVRARLLRQVRRLNDAASLGSLEARDAPPPPVNAPDGCAPMPAPLVAICERLVALRKRGTLNADDQQLAWRQVRAWARGLKRQRAPRPKLSLAARLCLAFTPLGARHPEAATARRVSA